MGSPHTLERMLDDCELSASGSGLKVEGGVGNMLAWGTTVPSDTTTGYAPGCVFIHTDGGAGSVLYQNEGTSASCDFNALNSDESQKILQTVDAATDTTLTAAQSGSLVLLNSSDVVTLPAAASSTGVYYRFLAQTVTGTAPQIDPNASEVINLQGTDLTGGKYADAAAIGDTLTLYCDGTKWWTIQSSGTWTSEA